MAAPARPATGWAIAGIAFLGGVGGGVVFPILPVIGMDLGISGFMIGLILSANRITRLGFNPVTGSLLDRFGARLHLLARQLRHARRGRSLTRRKRENMQPGKPRLVDNGEAVFEHFLGLGRKPRNDVRAEGDVRPRGAHPLAKVDGLLAAMATLHAF